MGKMGLLSIALIYIEIDYIVDFDQVVNEFNPVTFIRS